MIRMMLIYAVLFLAAASALWLGPSSTPGTTEVAEIPQVVQPPVAATPPAVAPVDLVGTEAPIIVAAPAAPPVSPPVAPPVSSSVTSPAETQVPQDVAALLAQSLEQEATEAVDLEPLLDDVPGSVRAPDGTRILASALLRRPDASITALPTPETQAAAAPAPVVATPPATVTPQRSAPAAVAVSARPQPAPEVLRRADTQDAPHAADEAQGEVRLGLASVIESLRAQSTLETEVGNVRTVSANPGAGPIASPDEPRTYVVQPGDSLLSIARTFYGDSDAYREIFEANRDKLASIDAVQAGQTLRLP